MNQTTVNKTGGDRSNRRAWPVWILIFAVGIAAGALLFRGGDGTSGPDHDHTGGAAEETIWTCSMHPQIQLPKPGKCPICFMDLIPLEAGGDESETQLSMSEAAMRLAEITTVPVGRRTVEAEVRTVGKVMVDERRVRKITAWVGGRLDRLFVDYTGVRVSRGDHLVEIYSPELYSSQVELIESLKARENLKDSAVGFLKKSAESTVEAAREKLRLLGLKPDQIAAIERRGAADEHITIYAPIEGVVIHKAAVEGEYVKTGNPIYTIAELSKVWVILDVYESNLVRVAYGQDVSFEVEAFPGETFHGTVTFIDPVVDPRTRTVKVRLNAENKDLQLKPNMFVRATIRSGVRGDGQRGNAELAGKWISPMHPEIVKDGPGSCDICGMPLVRAEELGLVADPGDGEDPLIIPATAPLITGRRAVVYVRVPGTDKPTFEGREVVLGPRAGDFYVVRSGLAAGEDVVVNGAFKIDSAMQIQARPSMMSPEGGAPAPGHQHGPASQPAHSERLSGPYPDFLEGVYGDYLDLHAALAGDSLDAARGAWESLGKRVSQADPAGLASDAARSAWNDAAGRLASAVASGGEAGTLDEARKAFEQAVTALVALEHSFGPPPGADHRLAYCPMAFDNQGAFWLQAGETVQNPYFGASMLRCGEFRETFTAEPGESR